MYFKVFIVVFLVIGLSSCKSTKTNAHNTNLTDIPKIDEKVKVIKVPIITVEDLNN